MLAFFIFYMDRREQELLSGAAIAAKSQRSTARLRPAQEGSMAVKLSLYEEAACVENERHGCVLNKNSVNLKNTLLSTSSYGILYTK
ncbi:hypothetical protein SAMN05192534_1025 [Alteribacillus persepolensis]|uniref:Uncharacterized protein n=1 Tax=Alteribacillus persepolensis TaxID=568899 RepID=A0A1G8A331_9BACI|nr:hypothetical protein SAMN05192534_1025 [Alteribacillus persepolensis]